MDAADTVAELRLWAQLAATLGRDLTCLAASLDGLGVTQVAAQVREIDPVALLALPPDEAVRCLVCLRTALGRFQTTSVR
ncbi:hypothetical protein [Muricoccus aerilatus]|uniref:hypothetical protein n=1 Tax=Muricoccus aerilatus TaxID=452982 RepID=UPI0005C1EFE7|nr:hypothetical protein [Roseomonas aerilata]